MAIIDAAFVIKHDRELIKADLTLHQRPFHVAIAWMKEQGYSGPFLDDAIWKPLMSIYGELYPSGDFSVPALFEGGVALRDRMYKIRVNVGFGQFAINPIDCIEIPKQELEVIYKLEPEQFWMAFYSVGPTGWTT